MMGWFEHFTAVSTAFAHLNGLFQLLGNLFGSLF